MSFAGGGVESGIEEVAILLGRLLLILSKLNLWGILLIMFTSLEKLGFMLYVVIYIATRGSL